MEKVAVPERVARSSRRVVYRRPEWRVHQFTVGAGGGVLCRAAALRLPGALLLWLGGGEGPAELGAVALGVPAAEGRAALATPLAGAGATAEAAAALARRLAQALARPVHVCCGAAFDRFTAPLVERGLIAEIKSRPDCFQ
ncbi:uncharacterized protein LOC126367220 [Pectinophora gossypiella]|uniref:uncharacterized protein LOC126367220 n=1 Tax=Pectinophora gossypiella TaxID=13191 RepID=UPI00214E4F8F|nr:uncharacterized protein LOC126367220 [Pectinophora gossypiella]